MSLNCMIKVVFLLVVTTHVAKCEVKTIKEEIEGLVFNLGNSTKELLNKLIPGGEMNFPKQQNCSLDVPMIGGQYNASNIRITGITDFDFTEFQFELKLLKKKVIVSYQLKFRKIRATLLYDLKTFLAKLVHVRGTGDIDFDFELDISGPITIKLNSLLPPYKVWVDEFQVRPTIYPNFQISGLTVGERMSKLASRQMTDIISTLINQELGDCISILVGGLLKCIINFIITDVIGLPFDLPKVDIRQLLKETEGTYKTEL